MSGLLATLVASRRLQPEPVATDALVHLCATSPAAGSVLGDLLAQVCPGAHTDGLTFTGQDINPDTEGRPDLVASDAQGVRLVLEAKFDAELTPAQTGGAYVQKLTTGVPGALVFLVPADRMRNVWARVSVTPGGASQPASLPVDGDETGSVAMPLPGTAHALAVISWDALLNQVGAALEKAGDSSGTAELAQIRGLVEWRSRTGWTPLVSDDLPQRTARQLLALTEVVRSVSARASVKKVRNGTADGGPGRHLNTPTGKSVWVGVYFPWWDKFGPGPLWAKVGLKSNQQLAITSEAMSAEGIAHQTRADHSDVLIPLVLPEGAERQTVEDAVLAQVEAVIRVVDSLEVEVIADAPTGEAADPLTSDETQIDP